MVSFFLYFFLLRMHHVHAAQAGRSDFLLQKERRFFFFLHALLGIIYVQSVRNVRNACVIVCISELPNIAYDI